MILEEFMLIKGVNKRIVEINNPQSDYFEKVIFYIKDDAPFYRYKQIIKEAKNYLRKLCPSAGKLVCNSKLFYFLAGLLISGIGAIIYIVLNS